MADKDRSGQAGDKVEGSDLHLSESAQHNGVVRLEMTAAEAGVNPASMVSHFPSATPAPPPPEANSPARPSPEGSADTN